MRLRRKSSLMHSDVIGNQATGVHTRTHTHSYTMNKELLHIYL